jgi:glycosyl transferase family 25
MENIHKIVYINLDRRTDRRAEVEAELAKMGLKSTRFSAIENKKGIIGCIQSHLEVIKLAKSQAWPNILILEDDFMFLVDREELEKQMKAFFDAKIPYDLVMLGYTLYKSEPFNDTVAYARRADTTSGYIVHERFYDELIKTYENGLINLIATGNGEKYAADTCTIPLQQTKEWFYFIKRIGKQRPSYSDILNKFVAYKS